ncbi:ATPase [Pandoraea terrae]|uniref:ATPase n=1 Tax=Pandoraea terrae TaxID=1537710 RepID=A0A5E4RKR3_9BURK|nr:ATPase [Pandoraea terrae]VVD63114.1 ATPase [Pandoraea terrae]
MLTDLEHLTEKIEQLVVVSQRFHQHNQALLSELERARAECEETRGAAEQLRQERDALRLQRDQLAAKIDEAQVRLNAILEKLPNNSQSEGQMDLLGAPGGESA